MKRKVDGQRLREARDNQGLYAPPVVEKVKEITGRKYDPSYVYMIENGRRQPSGALFNALCRIYKVAKEDVLLPGENEQAAAA